ncbi:MAG: gliding motility-associated ABC transporter substrate-binding protein GldG [Bacteroidales bacterium]|jgi:ABC-2 type transport system permease protein
MKEKKTSIIRQSWSQLLLVIGIIIVVNLISTNLFTRFDLTNEKRYTLSKETRELIKNVDDIVYFRVFLEGEFPAGFKRLKRETKELLDEFRAYNKNIEYEFINPSASEDQNDRNATYQLLVQQGLQPTNLQVKTKTGLEQQVIFPGALVSYRNNEATIELLDAQMNVPPEGVLNNSIENLEFKLANAIYKITRIKKPTIAFIEGQGELDEQDTYDLAASLQENYIVDRIRIDSKLNALVNRMLIDSVQQQWEIAPKYAAIIIAKPDSMFSGKDRFIIDQYLMYGGKILWFVDPVLASMDSISGSENTVAIAKNLDLQSQLFTYGVRLNKDLVMDLSANSIPIRTGQMGNQPQIEFFPWYYFPIVTPTTNHPIGKNLNAISTQFVSSIDTLTTKNVKKTILLSTSPYSRIEQVPALISLSMLSQQPDPRQYTNPPQAIAVLLEGTFSSDFKNRIPPEIINDKGIGFKEISVPTAMLVVSDGDMVRNQFQKGKPLPLGYDQYTRETFGNKDFVMNAINYLTEGPGLISLRSREMKLRLLDKTKVNESKLTWQLFNILAPVLLIITTGLVLIRLRKRKYAR